MSDPSEVLEQIAGEAQANLNARSVTRQPCAGQIEYVCKCVSNRAGVRLLMACMLGKIDDPKVDPREPYTEIGTQTCFSGRTFDEEYLGSFIATHRLPCNSTTAFLTPAFRNLDHPLTGAEVGRPRQMYSDSFAVLSEVAGGRLSAEDVLRDIIRWLVVMKNEQAARMSSLLESVKRGEGASAPSAESIITLLKQHLDCPKSSRLPVLGVAAAYSAVSSIVGERAMPLKGHNAADLQTGALGDVEICLASDDNLVTVYEMKAKKVSIGDIDHAITKVTRHGSHVDNYVFITSDGIDDDVVLHAASIYMASDGLEIVVLDYLGFLRHFLHFFHRYRDAFLNAYQELVLAEPDSAVAPTLKEAFLALRAALIADDKGVAET
jgi:hypothetical protein